MKGVHSPVNKKVINPKSDRSSSEIMQIPMEFFLCTVKELPDENIGIGGRTIDLIK